MICLPISGPSISVIELDLFKSRTFTFACGNYLRKASQNSKDSMFMPMTNKLSTLLLLKNLCILTWSFLL